MSGRRTASIERVSKHANPLSRSLAWALRATRSVPPDAVARAVVAISVPLLVGHMLGQPIAGVMVSLGSLWAVVHDVGPSHWTRAHRILVSGSASALGLAVGQWAVRMDNFAVIATSLTLFAVLAGWIGYSGTTGSIAGLQVLLGAVVGSGFVLHGPLWLAPLELLALWLAPLELLGGATLVLAMLGLSWRRANHLAEQRALTDSFAASFRLLTAVGTESAPRLRRSQTRMLDNAHRVVSRYGRVEPARPGAPVAEHGLFVLHIANESASIAAALAHEANPLLASVLTQVQTLPTRLEIPPPPKDTEIDPRRQRPARAGKGRQGQWILPLFEPWAVCCTTPKSG